MFFSTCEGSFDDVYVDGMMMCQVPKTESIKDVKYISCGGMK